MFEKCTNCGITVVQGRRDDKGVFCSQECQSYFHHPGYCQKCLSETMEENAGGLFTFNGIGTRFAGKKSRCQVCNSVIQTKCICFLFIPLIPLGKYRVLYVTRYSFHSRKINPAIPQF